MQNEENEELQSTSAIYRYHSCVPTTCSISQCVNCGVLNCNLRYNSMKKDVPMILNYLRLTVGPIMGPKKQYEDTNIDL